MLSCLGFVVGVHGSCNAAAASPNNSSKYKTKKYHFMDSLPWLKVLLCTHMLLNF